MWLTFLKRYYKLIEFVYKVEELDNISRRMYPSGLKEKEKGEICIPI